MRRRVAECGHERRITHGIESVQCPERVQSRDVGRGCAEELLERRYGGLLVPFDEEPLRGHAPPAVRVGKGCDKLRRSRRGQVRTRRTLGARMDQSVDTAKPHGLLEAELPDLCFEVAGDEHAVLDDAAIHVDDVERSVRCGGTGDGT